MSQLIVIYDKPADPAAFEDHYANRHLPLAAEKMSGVRDAKTYRVLSEADGSDSSLYRVAVMSWESDGAMRAAVGSEGGREVLADLSNFATGGVSALLCDDG